MCAKMNFRWSLATCVALLVVFSRVDAQYGGGTGEPNDPYLISTAKHLNAIGAEPNDWDKHFKLVADIDLSGVTYEAALIAADRDPDESGFQGSSFAGAFHGNGHTISHLTIRGRGCLGLFGRLACSAQIKGLDVVDVNITAVGDTVGGLAGCNNGDVIDCHSTGTVRGGRSIGGLIGANGAMIKYPGVSERILNCYSACVVSGQSEVGGLVGQNHGAVVRCFSTGSVSGDTSVGGLLGSNGSLLPELGPWGCTGGMVLACYSTAVATGTSAVGGLVGANGCGGIRQSCSSGSVSGGSLVGGLVGDNAGGSVVDCYATSDVSGNTCVGGLVGQSGYCWRDPQHPIVRYCFEGAITNCYATGLVTGQSEAGGLVGEREAGTVACSFWDVETSARANSRGGTGATTAQMQDPNTFIEAGWDFIEETENGTEEVWWIFESHDYPRLWWELPVEYVALVVDDFEVYSNDPPHRVFETWIDGLGVSYGDWSHPGNGTGALVGHDVWGPNIPFIDLPIMETRIVHGGCQSMPLYYDNDGTLGEGTRHETIGTLFCSEAERTFTTPSHWTPDGVATPQDWTVDEADTLTLHFHGEPDNDPEPLYVVIEDSAGRTAQVTHPDPDAVLATEWQAWHILLADLQAEGVNVASMKKVIIGIGDRDNPQPGGTGLIYIDDIWITKRMP